jgi:hypothetical protein
VPRCAAARARTNTPKSSGGRCGRFAAVSNRGRETAALRQLCCALWSLRCRCGPTTAADGTPRCPDFAISTPPLQLRARIKSCTCERVTRHHRTGWPAQLQPSPPEYSACQLAARDTPAQPRRSGTSCSRSQSCAMAAAMAHQAAAADEEAVREATAPVCRKYGRERCGFAGWRAHVTCQPPSTVK